MNKRIGFGFAVLTALFALGADAAVYYVDAVLGNDSFDGKSATGGSGNVGPKKTFEAGVALLTADNDELSVAPGTYDIESLSSCAKAKVKIYGRSGDPSQTVLNGQDKTSILALSGANVVVNNLTFSHGRNLTSSAKYSGALTYTSSGGLVSNCVFSACSNVAASYGGAFYMKGEHTVVGCVFRDNVGNQQGGAVWCSRTGLTDIGWFKNCTFERNSLSSTSSSYGGAIYSDKNHYIHLSGCTFTENTALSYGGAIYAQVVAITNCVFRRNEANSGGCYMTNTYQVPGEIADCKFYDNNARAGHGGALNISPQDGYTGMSIRRCVFERNRGGHTIYTTTSTGSGAVYVGQSGILEIVEDCVFRWNAATNLGISASNGSSTGGAGGALAGPVGTLRSCLFESNLAHYAGAAWHHPTASSVRERNFAGFRILPARLIKFDRLVTNCTFRGNACAGKVNRTATDRFSAVVTLASHASGASAWLMPSGPGDYTFVDCCFDSNRLQVEGTAWGCYRYGAALWAGAGVRLDRCGFTNNYCNGSGGAVLGYSTNGITSCSFVGNVASNTCYSEGFDGVCGGALALVQSDTNMWNVVSNCTFVGNRVNGSCGSAIAIAQGYLRLTDCTFENNTHKTNFTYMTPRGGAVAFEPRCFARGYYAYNHATYGRDKGAGYAMKCAIDRCAFKGNTTTGEGGALTFPIDFAAPGVVPGVEGYVRNCLFDGNEAFFGRNYAADTATAQKGAGGAVSVATGLAVGIENCTFSANKAAWQGGGLYCNSALSAVTNCVFYGNVDAESGTVSDNLKIGDASQVVYTFVPIGGPLGNGVNGNIVSDLAPFVSDDHCDHAVKPGCGRYVGLKLNWMTAESLDLGGLPRLAGEAVDFGCYQYWKKTGYRLIFK